MPAHDKQLEQKRIVAFLAEESQVPIAEVAILYEHERAELAVLRKNSIRLGLAAYGLTTERCGTMSE